MTSLETWLESLGFQLPNAKYPIEKLFSNGYNLGLLICKLGIGDLTEAVFQARFQDSLDDKAMCQNFLLCQRAMQCVSLKLKADRVHNLQNEVVGIAPALVYELKMHFLREKQRIALLNTCGLKSPIHRKRMPQSDAADDRIFKSLTTFKSTTNMNDRVNMYLNKFEAEMLDQELQSYREAEIREAQQLERRNLQHTKINQSLKENINFANETKLIGIHNWRANMRRKREHERKDQQYKLRKRKDKNKSKFDFKARRELEVKSGIEEFEQILESHSVRKLIPTDKSQKQIRVLCFHF
jgi:hypothetical protein